MPAAVWRAMSFHAGLSSSPRTLSTSPEASRDPRIMYLLASGVCSFKMNIPKMPAERDRAEVRNCKEIGKFTSANGGLDIARAFRIVFEGNE